MAEPLMSLLDKMRGPDGKARCPWCGGEDFHLLPTERQPLALLHENEGRSWFEPPGYLRSYALTCRTCCFVAVMETKDGSGPESDDGSGD